ncbi:hypothetical protein [Aestuariivivens sediminis]|uniref:hypothetical protein n=1 Tax=Aestuariivivens sediminis TaxID=2913557 RepID=UPI001F57A2F5|nr:hypothetical protein [Aestuariivivens sediminis]
MSCSTKYRIFILLFYALGCLSCGKTPKASHLSQKDIKHEQFVSLVGLEVSDHTASEVALKFTFTITPGYHIQPDVVDCDNFIATQFKIAPSLNYDVKSMVFEFEPRTWHMDHYRDFKVISEGFTISVVLEGQQMHLTDLKKHTAELFYQACDAKKCFFPRTLVIPLDRIS